jgi:hypothetical protein
MPNDLCTTRDLARRFLVSPETITAWARSGRIPCRRYSRKAIRYSLNEVLAALGEYAAPHATVEPQSVLA